MYWITSEFFVVSLWLESSGAANAVMRYGATLQVLALVVLLNHLHASKRLKDIEAVRDSIDIVSAGKRGETFIVQFRDGSHVKDQYARDYLQYQKHSIEGAHILSVLSTRLGRVQIEIAIFGTLLSGFGDYFASFLI